MINSFMTTSMFNFMDGLSNCQYARSILNSPSNIYTALQIYHRDLNHTIGMI